MIVQYVALALLLSAQFVVFAEGKSDGCDYLRQGYFDHFQCTLSCYRDVFRLSYIYGDMCRSSVQLGTNNARDVPFQWIVKSIQCIAVRCRSTIPPTVCDNGFAASANNRYRQPSNDQYASRDRFAIRRGYQARSMADAHAISGSSSFSGNGKNGARSGSKAQAISGSSSFILNGKNGARSGSKAQAISGSSSYSGNYRNGDRSGSKSFAIAQSAAQAETNRHVDGRKSKNQPSIPVYWKKIFGNKKHWETTTDECDDTSPTDTTTDSTTETTTDECDDTSPTDSTTDSSTTDCSTTDGSTDDCDDYYYPEKAPSSIKHSKPSKQIQHHPIPYNEGYQHNRKSFSRASAISSVRQDDTDSSSYAKSFSQAGVQDQYNFSPNRYPNVRPNNYQNYQNADNTFHAVGSNYQGNNRGNVQTQNQNMHHNLRNANQAENRQQQSFYEGPPKVNHYPAVEPQPVYWNQGSSNRQSSFADASAFARNQQAGNGLGNWASSNAKSAAWNEGSSSRQSSFADASALARNQHAGNGLGNWASSNANAAAWNQRLQDGQANSAWNQRIGNGATDQGSAAHAAAWSYGKSYQVQPSVNDKNRVYYDIHDIIQRTMKEDVRTRE